MDGPRVGAVSSTPDVEELTVRVGDRIQFSAAADHAVGFVWWLGDTRTSEAQSWAFAPKPGDVGERLVSVAVLGEGVDPEMRFWYVTVAPATSPQLVDVSPPPGTVTLAANAAATFHARARGGTKSGRSDRLQFTWTLDGRTVHADTRPGSDGVSDLPLATAQPGAYDVKLRVRGTGGTTVAIWHVQIGPATTPPVALAGEDLDPPPPDDDAEARPEPVRLVVPEPAVRGADTADLPALAARDGTVLEGVDVERGAAPVVHLRLSAPAGAHARTLPPGPGTPPRVYIDLPGVRLGRAATPGAGAAGPVLRVRTGQFDATTARVVLDLASPMRFVLTRDARGVALELRPPAPAGAIPAPPVVRMAALPAAPLRSEPPPPAVVHVPPPVVVAGPDASPEIPPATHPPAEPAPAPAPNHEIAAPPPLPSLADAPRVTDDALLPSAPAERARELAAADVFEPAEVIAPTDAVAPGEVAIAAVEPTPAVPGDLAGADAPASDAASSMPPTEVAESAPSAPPVEVAASAPPAADAEPAPPVETDAAEPLAPEPVTMASAAPVAPPEAAGSAAVDVITPEPAPIADTRAPEPPSDATASEEVATPVPPPPAKVHAAPPPAPPKRAPTSLAAAPRFAPPPSPGVGGRAVVVIDPGHGGRDPGAAGVGGVREKDVVLAVAQRLAATLTARLPVTVVMTRTDDSFVPIDGRVAMTGEDAALFLSLHANACSDPSPRGFEIFYGGGRLRTASTGGQDPRARLFGRCLQNALSDFGLVRHDAQPGSWGVLSRNHVPSVLLEIGYLTHPEEAVRTQDPAYQDRLAAALTDGIGAFLRASAPPL